MASPKSTATKTAKKAAAKKTAARGGGGKLAAPAPTQVTDLAEIKRLARGEILRLPSGIAMRCRRVDLQTFVREGTVPNALMSIVDEAVNKGKKIDLEEAVNPDNIDNESLMEMFDLIEEVILRVVLEPKVHRLPTIEEMEAYNEENPDDSAFEPADLKDDNLLYIDEINDEDKMFLFQWAAGGTSDVAQFRKEAKADMDVVAQIQSSGGKAK